MVRVHLIHQPDLDPVAHGEGPVDGWAVGAAGAVQEPPVHGGGGGEAVDLDHVVFPLDPLGTAVAVGLAFTVVVVGAMPTVMFHRGGIMGCRRLGDRFGREQLHATLGTVTRFGAGDLRVHRADIGRCHGCL